MQRVSTRKDINEGHRERKWWFGKLIAKSELIGVNREKVRQYTNPGGKSYFPTKVILCSVQTTVLIFGEKTTKNTIQTSSVLALNAR